MSSLITVLEFIAFRKVSKKQDEEKVLECISQAEETDLIKMIGDFYFDVSKNKDSEEWNDLLNGSEFEYNGEDYIHKGLKRVLADLAYARYSYNKNINDTSHGFVFKEYQDGKTIDRNLIKDISAQAIVDAYSKFKFVECYILSKPDLFSRYCKNKKGSETASFNGNRFSVM